MVLTHFDVVCFLLLNRRMATWNYMFLSTGNQNARIKQNAQLWKLIFSSFILIQEIEQVKNYHSCTLIGCCLWSTGWQTPIWHHRNNFFGGDCSPQPLQNNNDSSLMSPETTKSHRVSFDLLSRVWYEKFDEKSLLFKMCNKNHCMRKKRSNTARSKNGNNFIEKVKTGFQFKIKLSISVVFLTLQSVSSFYALLNWTWSWYTVVVQTSKDGKLPFHLTFTRRMTFSNA